MHSAKHFTFPLGNLTFLKIMLSFYLVVILMIQLVFTSFKRLFFIKSGHKLMILGSYGHFKNGSSEGNRTLFRQKFWRPLATPLAALLFYLFN